MLYPLSKMKIGQTATVIWLSDNILPQHSPVAGHSGNTTIKNRLLDLGFEPGTDVICLLKKHGDELSAFLVKGAVIALRREDAELVLVEEPRGGSDISFPKKQPAAETEEPE